MCRRCFPNPGRGTRKATNHPISDIPAAEAGAKSCPTANDPVADRAFVWETAVMNMSLARVRVAHLLVAEALVLALAAAAVTYRSGDVVGRLFGSGLTIKVIPAL